MSLAGMLMLGFGPTGTVTVPDTPTLTVADQEDGTGATATIADGSASASNEVFVAPWTGLLSELTYASEGTRSGNGTVDLSLANGYHIAYVVSTLNGCTAVSAPVYFRTTSGSDPVWRQCLDAIQAVIRSLSLTNLESASVVVNKLPVPIDRTPTLPSVIIAPAPESMDPDRGTNVNDEIGYRCLITIIHEQSAADLSTGLTTVLDWRQQITRALRNQRLSGVNEVYRVVIEPRDVIIPRKFAQNLDIQTVVARCISREPRGIA